MSGAAPEARETHPEGNTLGPAAPEGGETPRRGWNSLWNAGFGHSCTAPSPDNPGCRNALLCDLGLLWELLALLPISPLAFDGLQKSLCGTRMLLGCFCPKLLCCVIQKLHGSGEKSLRREERALGSSSVLV